MDLLASFVGDADRRTSPEVFLRVVRASGEWKSEARFQTWLYTIARNLCTDQARRAVHRGTLSLDAPSRPVSDDDSGPVLGDRVAGESGGGEDAAMNRQLADRIDRAVDALPADQREVFLMREVMDMPFAEIARGGGVNRGDGQEPDALCLGKLRDALGGFHDAAVTSRLAGAASPGWHDWHGLA